MTQRGLFIPGLFVSQENSKYRALKKALAQHELDFLEFAPVYENALNYSALLKETSVKLEQPYDFVIAYCMGCTLYNNVLSTEPEKRKDKAIFLSPSGQLLKSPWWQRDYADYKDDQSIYFRANKYHPHGTDVPVKFWRSISEGAENITLKFHQNALALLPDNDPYQSSHLWEELGLAGISNIKEIQDNHYWDKNLSKVVELTKSFILD